MIRPLTLVTMLMAGVAGLYLYQTKHTSQMLDREIARTVKQTETAKERIGMLRGEWALLNEPERLSQLSQLHLGGLRTLAPTQFTALDQLAARLPAPVAPGTTVLPPGLGTDEAAVPAAPQMTATAAPAVAAPRPAARAASPEPQVAEARPAPPRPAPPRPPAPPAPQLAAATPPPALGRTIMAPILPVTAAPIRTVASEATAPGTVGAAVLRAMQARGQASPVAAAPAAAASAPPAPAYAPMMASAAPAPSSVSMLGGGRAALPPPVPFGTR